MLESSKSILVPDRIQFMIVTSTNSKVYSEYCIKCWSMKNLILTHQSNIPRLKNVRKTD